MSENGQESIENTNVGHPYIIVSPIRKCDPQGQFVEIGVVTWDFRSVHDFEFNVIDLVQPKLLLSFRTVPNESFGG